MLMSPPYMPVPQVLPTEAPQLVRLIFELRLECGREWSLQNFKSPQQTNVFQSVSSLCDIGKSSLANHHESGHRNMISENETKMTTMLIFTAISMVLDIYEPLSRIYIDAPVEEGKYSVSNPVHSSLTNSQQTGHVQRLTKVINLTTMDFHLAHLHQVLSRLDAIDISRGLLANADNTTSKLQEIRLLLRDAIESLKSTI